MPTRDFITLTAAMPAGTEITVDRASAGWELTCSICGAVTARDEHRDPADNNHAGRITLPRFAIGLQVQALLPDEGMRDVRVPLDVCGLCAPALLAPFLPFLEAAGFTALTPAAALEHEPAAALEHASELESEHAPA